MDHPDFTFAKLLDEIMIAKKIKICELVEQTGIERKTFSKILNRAHLPEKLNVITIGAVLGLNLEQMNIFLFKAGYALCPSIELDRLYIGTIQKNGGSGTKRIIACNEELSAKGVSDDKLL